MTDPNGFVIPHQVSLVFKSSNEVASNKYLLSFVADVPALGIAKFQITRDTENGRRSLVKTTFYNLNAAIDIAQ